MSERLTDERLGHIEYVLVPNVRELCERRAWTPDALQLRNTQLMASVPNLLVVIEELVRSLRAAALTSDEVEALKFAREMVQHSINGVREQFGKKAIINPLATAALSALDRILAAAEVKS